MITIYHNPRCGKSRRALGMLESKEHKVVEYLKEGISADVVGGFYDAVGVEIIRVKEDEFDKRMEITKENVVKAIVNCPKLLQRPVLVCGDKIILGRDEENVREFLANVN